MERLANKVVDFKNGEGEIFVVSPINLVDKR